MKKVYYYALQPSDTTSAYRIHGVLPYIQHPDFLLIDISHYQHFTSDSMKGCDILIFQRPFTKQHADLILLCKSMGIKVILDYDDLLTAVDMYNPTYHLYQAHQETLLECIKMADELWVSTETIKAEYRHFNTYIVPNAHNDYIHKVEDKLPFTANKKVIYRGGASHKADVYEKGELLVETINGNTGWTFTFMGDRYEWLEQRTGDNHHIVGGMSIPSYFSFIYRENPSIFIFPLCTTLFNRAKSNISWLEASYVGSVFFGNTDLPEFNPERVLPIDELNGWIKEGDPDVMDFYNRVSWMYICDILLLSKVNEIRKERILANL